MTEGVYQIRDIRASGSAIVGHPVALVATVVIGSSSCNKFDRAVAEQDDESRTVTVTAYGMGRGGLCTGDVHQVQAVLEFTPTATGSYLIKAAEARFPYYPDSATLSLEVLPQ